MYWPDVIEERKRLSEEYHRELEVAEYIARHPWRRASYVAVACGLFSLALGSYMAYQNPFKDTEEMQRLEQIAIETKQFEGGYVQERNDQKMIFLSTPLGSVTPSTFGADVLGTKLNELSAESSQLRKSDHARSYVDYRRKCGMIYGGVAFSMAVLATTGAYVESKARKKREKIVRGKIESKIVLLID